MKKHLSIILVFIYIISPTIFADHKFRVYLKDKEQSEFTINNPKVFLSEKALERREKQKIAIEESDLPLSKSYTNTIEKLGFPIVAKSKWHNTVSISTKDSIDINKLGSLDFIEEIMWVGKSNPEEQKNVKSPFTIQYPKTKSSGYYGYGSDQIYTVNGQKLHEKGFRGDGMEIAIIDAGFTNLKEILYLSNVKIKGTKDFSSDAIDMFSSNEHGIGVLSAMATNQPNTLVGTAPKAEYWLFRSEVGKSEYPIEEDYWVTALEYADSLGINIVNTSLGYQEFDLPARSYTHEEMNGKTSFMSIAAGIAADKGMLLVVSAGNEGNKTWKKITVPADAENVLTVGSMNKDSIISTFSSVGPTADGRVKPDVIAMGENINLLDSKSEIIVMNGTSFAAPIITGLAACLWQAYPKLTNKELINIICSSSNRFKNPGFTFGYGVPDMELAITLAKDITTGIEETLPIEESKYLFSFQSDSIGHINIKKTNMSDDNDDFRIQIYSIEGKILVNEVVNGYERDFYLNQNSKRPYIIYIIGQNLKESRKLLF